MKKVLSLVLVCMMMASLFAMNASASVATYEGFENATIMPLSENVKSALPYIRLKNGVADGVLSAFETVDDNEVAVLRANPTNTEWIFGGETLTMEKYDKYVLTFDVKVVDCANAFQVAMKTIVNNDAGNIAFMVSPATFMGKELPAGSTGGSAVVENADATKLNQWFNFKVTVDKTVMSKAATIDETVRRNAMKIEYKKAEDESYAVLPYMTGGYYANKIGARADGSAPTWTNTAVAFSPDNNTYAFCYDKDGNNLKDNAEYHLDNVQLIGRTTKVAYPAKGVMLTEDFEGSSPVFAGGQGTIKGDDAEKYLDFYKSDTVHTNTYGASKEFKPAILPQEFVFTADVYKEADNTQDLVVEYFTDTLGVTDKNGQLIAGVASGIVLDKNKLEAGKWYTVKIVRKNITYPAVTLIDKETGEEQNFNAATRANVSGSSSYNRLFFRALNTAGSISHWRIDNVMLTEAGAASLIGKTVDEETGATTLKFNVDAKAYATTPVFATFNGDRLVSADFEDVTLSADGAEVEFAVPSGCEEAVLYLWDGIGGAPVMEAWDVTEYIAE